MELPDDRRERLGVHAQVAEGDEDGEGVAVEAGVEDVRHVEREIQGLPGGPGGFLVHRRRSTPCRRRRPENRSSAYGVAGDLDGGVCRALRRSSC